MLAMLLRSWWHKIRKPLEVSGIIVASLLMLSLLVVVVLTYIFNVNVPGLHGKTLWDWLQLLIIPAVLAIGGYLFTYTTGRNERRAAAKRDQTERDIALDNQQEATLQEYINKMSELLLDKKLRESDSDAEVRKLARVRTITVLPRLNPSRKRSLLQFLYEAGLINKGGRIVDLTEADLSKASLSFIHLSGADLSEANLSETDLSRADLSKAYLFNADLTKATLCEAILVEADLFAATLTAANLSEANLLGATMCVANLTGATLTAANLSEANLTTANLTEANLTTANLTEATLTAANLTTANLTGATLTAANLSDADLSDSNLKVVHGITIEELRNTARSLKGATIPDGSKHP